MEEEDTTKEESFKEGFERLRKKGGSMLSIFLRSLLLYWAMALVNLARAISGRL